MSLSSKTWVMNLSHHLCFLWRSLSLKPTIRCRSYSSCQQVLILPLNKETTLTKPPDMELISALARRLNIIQQVGAFAERSLHKPNSFRTRWVPSTMCRNFSFAAQRAVWLSPQSGARERRSAGANARHRLIRSTTSSTLSI